MTSLELQDELKTLDERFSVLENESRLGLSNIFFMGLNYDLPVISTSDIREEVDQSHRYRFPNGMFARFWSRPEIIDRCKDFLRDFKDGKYDGLYE